MTAFIPVSMHPKSIHICLLKSLRKFSRQQIDYMFFLNFFQKTEFDISCKLAPAETICVKCQILFSDTNKKIFQNVAG